LHIIEAIKSGRSYLQALGDVQEVCDVLRYYDSRADKTYGRTIKTSIAKDNYTIRKPTSV
jgi:acyl-CoA reductase-like NAD-dependent aldehyde dehydrogenase